MISGRLQKLRLITGLILFAFVTLHLLNLALGNISLEALEVGRDLFLALWRNPVGTFLLYGSFLIHGILVAYSLFRRQRLRMPWQEAVQIIFGFLIPALLAVHIVGNRLADEWFDIHDSYVRVLIFSWVFTPKDGIILVIAVLVVWVHSIAGLYFWLRLKPRFRQFQTAFFCFALLMPAFALSGFTAASKQVLLLAQDEDWLNFQIDDTGRLNQEQIQQLLDVADNMRIGSLATVVGVLVLRFLYMRWQRRGSRITVRYPNGREVIAPIGTSILDVSRLGNIPHASVCGGRGRCSTCRVRVVGNGDTLAPASEAEARVLKRVNAGEHVRLACQLRPNQDVTVVPLLPAAAQAPQGFSRPRHLQGVEQEIAILFADLRSFTSISEGKLPYDLVFLINQYFRASGSAIERAGGHLDKFIGDGVMALFGVEGDGKDAARNALRAAKNMGLAMAQLNADLQQDLPQPLRIGIGIHFGPAIVGEMGYRAVTALTAIGDSVNTASRIESSTKEFGAELVVSAPLIEKADVDLSAYPAHEITVRGRKQPLQVYVIADAKTLPDF